MFETMADITDCAHLDAPGRFAAIVAWCSISLLVFILYCFGSAKIHTIEIIESVKSQKCNCFLAWVNSFHECHHIV